MNQLKCKSYTQMIIAVVAGRHGHLQGRDKALVCAFEWLLLWDMT